MIPSWVGRKIISQLRFGGAPTTRYVVVLLIHLRFIITSCALLNTMLIRVQGSWYGSKPCHDHGLGQAVASGDAHILLTPWRNGYHLARYRGDAGDFGGWVACHWEDRHEMERGVLRFVGPWTSAYDTELKQVYPCWGKNKIQVAWCTVYRSPNCGRRWWSSAATCPLPPTCLDGGPVVHGQVGRSDLTLASAAPQPNQQCETV